MEKKIDTENPDGLDFQFNAYFRTFTHNLVCPTCSAPLTIEEHHSSMVDLCAVCEHPFEWYNIQLSSGKGIPWVRRAEQRFCTFTGDEMQGVSLLESREVGQSSFRNSSVYDPQCRIFGFPKDFYHYQFRLHENSCKYNESKSDKIVSLSVVNGDLVSCTNKGTLQVYNNILDDMSALGKSQSWVGVFHQNQEIEFPPAFCGKHSLTVASPAYISDVHKNTSSLCFRTLEVMRGTDFSNELIQLDMEVVGHPFLVEVRGEQKFAVWCGHRLSDLRVEKSHIQIYSFDGKLEYSIQAKEMARTPLYIKSKHLLCSVSTNFRVLLFDLDTLSEKSKTYAFTSQYMGIDPVEDFLYPSKYPTLVASLNRDGSEDIWLAYTHYEKHYLSVLQFSVFSNHQVRLQQKNVWKDKKIKHLYALSVGHHSPNPDCSHYADKLAVSTSEACFVFNKNIHLQQTLDVIKKDDFSHHLVGSRDPAILSGAGVLVRLAGKVQLSFKTLKIKLDIDKSGVDTLGETNSLDRSAPEAIQKIREHNRRMGQSYNSGMVLLGRRLFVAHKLNIFVFDLVLNNPKKKIQS